MQVCLTEVKLFLSGELVTQVYKVETVHIIALLLMLINQSLDMLGQLNLAVIVEENLFRQKFCMDTDMTSIREKPTP